jgi:hypothetical protein
MMVPARLGSSCALTTGTREETIGRITAMGWPKWQPLIKISLAPKVASVRDLKGNSSPAQEAVGPQECRRPKESVAEEDT